MTELRVQQIGKSRYVCLPTELLRGNPEEGIPPLDIEAGDKLFARRTKTGIFYEPAPKYGSQWVLVPEENFIEPRRRF